MTLLDFFFGRGWFPVAAASSHDDWRRIGTRGHPARMARFDKSAAASHAPGPMTEPSLIDELNRRQLIQDLTARGELERLLSHERIVFYVGFDPTAPSLHLGNLVPIALMARLQRAGHKPLALVGGATGMIGDPSGKSAERSFLDRETIARNLAGLREQLQRFLDFDPGPSAAEVVNNAEWFEPISYLAFLRDVGKHISVNYMMAKESVRARLSDRDLGISYTEFSYMLLQAYDFVHLARTRGCRLQSGASDQWGNITAGIELSRKLDGPQLFGMTCPLLVDAQGNKMGKTAGGMTIWLDADKTSPYALYQYLLNVSDQDAGRLLRMLSFTPWDALAGSLQAHQQAPERREAQRALAKELCARVHGEEAARRSEIASGVIFGASLEGLSDADLSPLLADIPSSEVQRQDLATGITLVDVLTRARLAASRGAARRLISGGGVYLNNRRISDPATQLDSSSLATETMLILRAGKKNYHIIRAI